MPTLELDQEEFWVIHEWVRRERAAPAYGEEHDLAFMQRVWASILELEDKEIKSYSLDCSRSELVQITRQVSTMIAMGQRPIGKELLKKCFAALLSAEKEEESGDAVPEVFRKQSYDDDADHSTHGESDAAVIT